ncbi:MAG: hypothetical protein J2P34_04770 [Actinobacteria bacterium]|nr:hypothetical protein [Actinomycetota bacterium]
MNEPKPGTLAMPRAGNRPHELVRLVTRLLLAQAGAAAAVGLPFSRRHLPSILITLALVAAILALTALVRTGGHGAWLVAISFESAYDVFGLSRFVMARYLGGTLFGIIVLVTLLQPSVARAFASRPGAAAPESLEDAADTRLSGRVVS